MILSVAISAQTQTPGDSWLEASANFPNGSPAATGQSNLFETLRAEAIAGKLRVSWAGGEQVLNSQQVTLRISAGTPGHWPARDWRSLPMTRRDTKWEAQLPVEDVDEPVIYFIQESGGGRTNLSPMRIVTPRAAGLEEPTRPFWPFLEGFEEGMESWRVLANGEPTNTLRIDPQTRTGRAALAVTLPRQRRSITVATTRVRGWPLQQRNATGIRLWARTREGSGQLRFALLSHAFTRDQVSSIWRDNTPVSNRWQKVDLFFRDLGAMRLGSVDVFTIEFTASAPGELLLDDLQLLGPWQPEP